MEPSLEARQLIAQGRLREASALIDSALGRKEDDDLWYLRGIISLRLENYEYAQECFEFARSIRNRAEYNKISGMAHLEMFEMEDALDAFARALALDDKDAETHFFTAVCMIFMDDPRSKKHMEKAYLRNARRVHELLGSFYRNVIGSDPSIREGVKKEIEKKISSV